MDTELFAHSSFHKKEKEKITLFLLQLDAINTTVHIAPNSYEYV